MKCVLKTLLIGFTYLIFASSTFAAPVLRNNIVVISPIVTVGDMFEDAGMLAEEALFRAPAPGTIGQVSVQSVRIAVAKVGIQNFENPGFSAVSVARKGINVDQTTLESLITEDLISKGVLRSGMSVTTQLNSNLDALFAQDTAVPVTLENLRYVPGNNQFSARFLLVGQSAPLDIAGQLNISILAPHLTRALTAGTVLQANDIEMRKLPLQFANNTGVPTLEQLIGHQLQRNQLAGALLRQNDVAKTILIARNQIVTLFLKSGPLTLTVKAQALENASQGESVSVLNLMSNKLVRGIAVSDATVEVSTTSNHIASL